MKARAFALAALRHRQSLPVRLKETHVIGTCNYAVLAGTANKPITFVSWFDPAWLSAPRPPNRSHSGPLKRHPA
jgi:hypothetical protein